MISDVAALAIGSIVAFLTVSDYEKAHKGSYDYLFFIYSDRFAWEAKAGVIEDLLKPEVFPLNLGLRGAVVKSYPSEWENNFRRLRHKEWPPEVEDMFGKEYCGPGFLVTSRELKTFVPYLDQFAIVDFSTASPAEVTSLFREIATVISSGEDFFEWWEKRSSNDHSQFKRLTDAIEAKPGIWGFRVDLKKVKKILKF